MLGDMNASGQSTDFDQEESPGKISEILKAMAAAERQFRSNRFMK
jgi:hypothetical protein